MTARQVWEGMLTELSKANAPSLLLHEFNYYFNKAISQYINRRYTTVYDTYQLFTDDLRVLKATAILPAKKSNAYNVLLLYGAGKAKLFAGTYEVYLPNDYLHMLNCVCIYNLSQDDLCYNKGDDIYVPATRLTSDAWSIIATDYYHRPLPWRPYYFIHNVNQFSTVPTNPVHLDEEGNLNGTDLALKYEVEPLSTKTETKVTWIDKNNKYYIVKGDTVYNAKGNSETDRFIADTINTEIQPNLLTRLTYEIPLSDNKAPVRNSNFPRTIKLNELTGQRSVSTVIKDAGTRYGNASRVRCEIRYGNDDSVYQLKEVHIDYIKAPQTIRLTKEQVDLTEDTSQIMEFPDYVCQEIINELVILVMHRDADPRINGYQAVTTSIVNPTQTLTPQQTSANSLQS